MGFLLEQKDETFSHFHVFQKWVEKEKNIPILRVRSDKYSEFVNYSFITYFEENGIKHELVLKLKWSRRKEESYSSRDG